MSNNAQGTILAAFNEASGGMRTNAGVATLSSDLLSTATEGMTTALSQATQVITAQTQATSANTAALASDAQIKGGGTVSEVTSVLSTASQFLGGGLTLMPLVSLFTSLFGGGESTQPAPLVPFSLPPSLNLESTTNQQSVSWGENGMPRASGGSLSNTPQQVTVQVQAMDSQSFLDHSNDIAQAVRQAMLNMNPLNDVVTSL